MSHPIRNAELHVFARVESNGKGAEFIARFHPYDNWPVFFKGGTPEEAESKAKDFRWECIKKHEANVIRRQEQAESMRKRKKKESP